MEKVLLGVRQVEDMHKNGFIVTLQISSKEKIPMRGVLEVNSPDGCYVGETRQMLDAEKYYERITNPNKGKTLFTICGVIVRDIDFYRQAKAEGLWGNADPNGIIPKLWNHFIDGKKECWVAISNNKVFARIKHK